MKRDSKQTHRLTTTFCCLYRAPVLPETEAAEANLTTKTSPRPSLRAVLRQDNEEVRKTSIAIPGHGLLLLSKPAENLKPPTHTTYKSVM